MLQQTRVAAVIPYYERFLSRFPDFRALAEAPESGVLAAWSGLGYYSRARNLQRAARQMVEGGGFPTDYAAIRALAGVGEYTAAAVASIAFGVPRAAVDGNVLRVLSRLLCDSGDVGSSQVRRRLSETAAQLLDGRNPGEHNQAMMELGATVCLPRAPLCADCPVAPLCEAKSQHRQNEFPVKSRRTVVRRVELRLLWITRNGAVLARRRPEGSSRLAGFWELPKEGQVPAVVRSEAGSFRHSITNHQYSFRVLEATIVRRPPGFIWLPLQNLEQFPVSTVLRKALAVVNSIPRNAQSIQNRVDW
jgi:A/G-specific adenine glycosylase